MASHIANKVFCASGWIAAAESFSVRDGGRWARACAQTCSMFTVCFYDYDDEDSVGDADATVR